MKTLEQWMAQQWPVVPGSAGFLRLERTFAHDETRAWRAWWRYRGSAPDGSAVMFREDGAEAVAATAEGALADLWAKMLLIMARLAESGAISPDSPWLKGVGS